MIQDIHTSHKTYFNVIENSRFPWNIDIPRNIRAKLGGSPEYWGESRNIDGIENQTLDQFSLLDIHEDGYFSKIL